MKKQQIRMYLTIIIIIALFIALVLSSLAWFEANHYASDSAVVTSAKSMEISLSIPDEQINSESYMGQTGVEYEVWTLLTVCSTAPYP